jgi:hypothetical protein
MITFANPAWLYGLLGLLVPIGIHLLSRKEGKTIYIGSIRHLTDSDTAQFSSIKLNEILLLILRLLMLSLLIFILAGFSIDFKGNENKKWLVIEKGIEKDQNYKSLIKNATAKGYEIRWLSESLPVYRDSLHAANSSSYYTLIAQINEADSAIVLSYNFSNQFKGEKIALPQTIKWLHVEPSEKQIAIQATTLKSDSVLVRVSNSNANRTTFKYARLSNPNFGKMAKIDSLQILSKDTINISIFADPEFEYDKKIIQASLQAIANGVAQELNISVLNNLSALTAKSDFIFWLSEKPCSIKDAVVIGYGACSNPNLPLLFSHEKASYDCAKQPFSWIISKRLNEENVLEESFSFSLATILLNGLSMYSNKNIALADRRAISSEAAFSDSIQNDSSRSQNESYAGNEPVLLIFLFLILIVERYIAYKRNQ